MFRLVVTAVSSIAFCFSAWAQDADTELVSQPGVLIADLLPPAELYDATNVAIMRNDGEMLEMTLELRPAGDVMVPGTPFMLTTKSSWTRMIGRAIDSPGQFAADAQDAAALGLPASANCVGSVEQGNIIYCRAGDQAIVQIGGSGAGPMEVVAAIAAKLPFEVYAEVFSND